ncbi:MAG: flagellar biosynthesis anti-sigma factor FlgM [Gammaproteobacteria bacterium]
MVTEVKSPGATVVSFSSNPTVKSDKAVAASPESGCVACDDVVHLTDLAARLQTLTQGVAEVPQVDVARVEALREAIASGHYQIDTMAVADKLMGLEHLLGGRSAE